MPNATSPDPALLAAEAEGRPVCHSFLTTGFCEFGSMCRYSHILPGFRGTSFALIVCPRHLISVGEYNAPEKPPLTDINTVPLNELPPSLWPPLEEDDYDTIEIAEWG